MAKSVKNIQESFQKLNGRILSHNLKLPLD